MRESGATVGHGTREEGASATAVGARVHNMDTKRQVRAEGVFLDDLRPANALEVVFVRSPIARGSIRGVDVERALALDGVHSVWTAADMGDLNGPVPVGWRPEGLAVPEYPALVEDQINYAGQPVAAVFAEDRATAEDGAALVSVDYQEQEPIVDARTSIAESNDLVHPSLGSNMAYHRAVRLVPQADHEDLERYVAEGEFRTARQTALPLERRGFIASRDESTGRLTIFATTQWPHVLRDFVADLLGVPDTSVRAVAPDLGGAFGVYTSIYPEDLVVVAASLRLGRPVAYREAQNEALMSTVHARQQTHSASLEVAQNGRFLKFRDDFVSDIGAFLNYSGVGPSLYTIIHLAAPYEIPDVDIDLKCAFTNKVRSGGYRGYGIPQAVFVTERLVDMAAKRIGMDPLEIRRINVRKSDSFPATLPGGNVMDSANLPGLLDLVEPRYQEFRQEQQRLREEGRDVGVGLAMYMEPTGTGSSKALGKKGFKVPGWEAVHARVTSDGGVELLSGASNYGQGIRTAIAQVAGDELGLPVDRIRVLTGDTDVVRHGNRGSIGSRSAVVAGEAARRAGYSLAQTIKRFAAELLEANEADLVLHEGSVMMEGVPGASMTFAELFREVKLRHRLSVDIDPSLEVLEFYEPPETMTAYGSGVHVALVGVDRTSGDVKLLNYAIGHDCGRVINPAIVDGQVIGGAVQGIGGALSEEIVYDERGQLATVNLMDYLMPRSVEIPDIEVLHQETLSPFHPMGVKGCGEAGTTAPGAAIANAVADAVDVPISQLPITPYALWSALADHD